VDLPGGSSWSDQLRESRRSDGDFVRSVQLTDQPLKLTQTRQLPAGKAWLILSISRSGSRSVRPRVRVLLNETSIGDAEIPFRNSWYVPTEPVVFPLEVPETDTDKPYQLQIEQLSPAGTAPVFWEGMKLTATLPMLRSLFEDSSPPIDLDNERPAKLVASPVYSGSQAVELQASGSYRFEFDRPLSIRERPDWGEFRFLRFAVRRHDGGIVNIEFGHDNSAIRPARYDMGQGTAIAPSAKRVWYRRLSEQWTVITRDLYADFGQIDVSSMTLSLSGGGAAYFDGCHAARSGNDFRFLPSDAD
jgi:hypothetical protein